MKFKLSDIEKELKKPQKGEKPSLQAINDQISQTVQGLRSKSILERNPAIFKVMVQYLAETKLDCREKGILYFGATGTGKTFSAKVIAAFRDIGFYDCNDMIRKYQDHKPSFWQIIDERKDIIIDDLGAEPTINDYGMKFELFSQALTKRHQLFESYGTKTIITTNLSGDAIKERYSERIYSRFKQMCECVNATGEDLRE